MNKVNGQEKFEGARLSENLMGQREGEISLLSACPGSACRSMPSSSSASSTAEQSEGRRRRIKRMGQVEKRSVTNQKRKTYQDQFFVLMNRVFVLVCMRAKCACGCVCCCSCGCLPF